MFVVFASDEQKLRRQLFRKRLFAAPTVTLWLTHSCKLPNLHPQPRCCFCMLLSLLSIK